MNYSSMNDLARQVSALQQNFDTMRSELNSLVESLDGEWQGKAQKEFAAAYGKLKPKLETISEVLQQFSTEVLNATIQESELEQQSAAANEQKSFS